MKVLLFGGNGQVGTELRRALAPYVELVVTTRSGMIDGVECEAADFDRPQAVKAVLERVQPELIINAAAYTAVDAAETDAEAAWRANAEAPAQIAGWCAQHGVPLVHYSTDYVFDGQGSQPYREDDATAPLGVYGQSKRAGEEAIIASGAPYLIFRTAWVYASHGRNFLRTMLRLGAEREQLGVVADQIGSPTSAALIADTTLAVLQSGQLRSGIWHLTASGQTSWHGFATEIFAQAHAQGLLASTPLVDAISTAEYPTPAKRPAWSVLDNRKLQQDFSITLPDWEQELAAVLGQMSVTGKA
ncbi:dTDP-4-dehydrorhamnose reductase [Stenotrophomonas koreensis]|uniref:dTDP-4-dehydrorhamnose reductase n=1 Tax=Stenotrophomonas koreensis TaxID=266128 RepID=A0A0R0BQM9_9GAMM|nr:dTDP-4-dehydrorhamnose reductase [Stenotrophomonas koreensis]KRG56666.1 dTDP-4-dehydrorhamnose reductase [Stenotrophomonas koreensis]